MTIDEAIKHCEEVAESCEWEAGRCDETDRYECHEMHELGKCAADHRQLAEWLTELKELRLTVGTIKVEDLKSALTLLREYKAENNEMREQIERYKRLLKAAVEDYPDLTDMWRYKDEALELIGETND